MPRWTDDDRQGMTPAQRVRETERYWQALSVRRGWAPESVFEITERMTKNKRQCIGCVCPRRKFAVGDMVRTVKVEGDTRWIHLHCRAVFEP